MTTNLTQKFATAVMIGLAGIGMYGCKSDKSAKSPQQFKRFVIEEVMRRANDTVESNYVIEDLDLTGYEDQMFKVTYYGKMARANNYLTERVSIIGIHASNDSAYWIEAK